MNKNLLIGLLAVVILLVGYLAISGKKKAPVTYPVETGTPVGETNPEVNQTSVSLSQQNDSGESGTATLVEENGQVVVTLNLLGGPENSPQPAHIHLGSCPDVGGVKYPLTNVVNGFSETSLDVTLAQLKSETPLGINVHKSVSEASVYTACGDLQF